MAKYIYPAVFTEEENGQYSVDFPDIKNCFTGGDSLEDAVSMANDVLCLTLYDLEKDGKPIPPASGVKTVQKSLSENEFVTLISCDTLEYRKLYDNKAVKKTLTIPAWLNTMAEKQGINFSLVLQNALKQQLALQ